VKAPQSPRTRTVSLPISSATRVPVEVLSPCPLPIVGGMPDHRAMVALRQRSRFTSIGVAPLGLAAAVKQKPRPAEKSSASTILKSGRLQKRTVSVANLQAVDGFKVRTLIYLS
jgi:hypothetical protein